MSLPEPHPDALAASHALLQLIANELDLAGGQLPFARFMELALYTPGLGYYSGGSAKLGAAGDFTTAPELSPLFGASVARAVAAIIAQSAPSILEFGAGTGKLAHDVLTALAADGVPIDQYLIVELSAELRQRQQQALAQFPQVRWLDALPDSFSGVVLANEVLDAMPVELVSKTANGWQQVTVTVDDGRLAWGRRDADAALAAHIARQIPDADTLDIGYVTEVHPVAVGFMETLARMLHAGAAILFDYGFPAHEYYVDDRTGGTVMCHYRHHAHPEPFYLPGLQDITAHVDFTAMALAAQDAGLDVLGYMNQASFLLANDIGDLLLRYDPADAKRYLPQANAVHKLVSPAEMGELFKVLVVGAGVVLPEAIARADRSHRL